MLRRPRTDFWQVGIVRAPIESISPQALTHGRAGIVWLPPAGAWRYLADPFGLLREDALHVFVEAFDYRSKHAVIERHEFAAADLQWRGHRTVLSRAFHLSYPFVFEHEGAAYMVPESHQANEIALYRSTGSLDDWERQCALISGVPGVDASLIRHLHRWWMFYAVVGPGGRTQRELHLAHAAELTGPWQPCTSNPVHVDRHGARPAGRPFQGQDGSVMLPVQDCSTSYGSALRMLRFSELGTPQVRIADVDLRLTGDLVSDDHVEGFHTLSACGPFTLFDVKRIDRSRAKLWLDLQRRARRIVRRLGA
jgi:hypothetical protein